MHSGCFLYDDGGHPYVRWTSAYAPYAHIRSSTSYIPIYGRHADEDLTMSWSDAGLFRDRGTLVQRVVVVEGHIGIDDLSKLCRDARIQLVVLDAVWVGKHTRATEGFGGGSAAHLSRVMVVPSSLSQSSSMPFSV